MVLRKVNFSLPAINSTSSGFTSKGGFPIVKFSVPSQQAWLETKSLRLTGRIQIKPTSSTLIGPNVTNFTDVLDEPNDSNLEECTAVTFSPFGGVKTSIDKVVIQSKKTQAELSSDNNYSQYVCLKESRFGIKSDFRNSLCCRSLSLGENARFSQRRLNLSDSTATTENQGQEFTIKLDVDLLQNNLLDLSDDAFGGLLVTLHLNPESAYFSTFQNGTTTAQTTSIDAYRYVFHQLKLEGRYQIPSSGEKLPTSFTMDNQINLLQDVHSSRSSNVLSPQSSIVKGIVNLFLLQSQTNSFNQSQYSFVLPPGLREINQNKNSARFPLKFAIEAVPNYATTNSENITSIYYKSLQTGVAEARLHFERALNDGKIPLYTSATMVLSEKAKIQQELASSSSTASNNLDVDSLGIGSDYTFGMRQAQNYKNQDYGLLLDSGVNTSASKLLSSYSSSALLQQSFVRNTALFDVSKLQKTM